MCNTAPALRQDVHYSRPHAVGRGLVTGVLLKLRCGLLAELMGDPRKR